MTDSTWAQLISLAVLLGISALLLAIRRKVAVASQTVTYTTADGVSHTVQKGSVIPQADVPLVPAGNCTTKTLSLFRSLIVGKDNRTSTSKTVVFAWTYAIAYGLIALIVAKWLGSGGGYDTLVDAGLREEYWLFLGGPYAAAIAAKYTATTQGNGVGKPAAGVGDENLTQLVADDEGNTDLGDFQYVLFNAITLAFYLGQFIWHLDEGLPHLPNVLTGLALVSAGGYSAKKLFLQQAAPTLNSVLPTSVTQPAAGAAAAQVEIWGANLIIPADVAPGGTALPPRVTVGGQPATVVTAEETLGADHLTVEVPTTLAAGLGPTKIVAVRADGVAATGPGGTDSLPLTIN
ncbi:MAG TPA: hypothetical protein VF101_09705 [Gaiellaceae bacterium]